MIWKLLSVFNLKYPYLFYITLCQYSKDALDLSGGRAPFLFWVRMPPTFCSKIYPVLVNKAILLIIMSRIYSRVQLVIMIHLLEMFQVLRLLLQLWYPSGLYSFLVPCFMSVCHLNAYPQGYQYLNLRSVKSFYLNRLVPLIYL